MPLIKSPSDEALHENIEREIAAGKPRKQAIAIGLETQRRAGGGKKKKTRPHVHSQRRGR